MAANMAKIEKLKQDMLQSFHNAQHVSKTDDSIKEILRHLKKLHKTPLFQTYITPFFELIVGVLRSPENNPNTRRLLEFIAEIIQKYSQVEQTLDKQKEKDKDEDDFFGDDNEPFESDKLILKISEHVRDQSVDVRANTCRLLKLVFEDFEQIDEEIYNQIQENIGYTSTDKDAKVRANGLLALASVANGETNVVNKKKQFIAKYDPEVTVRVCAFRTLAAIRENCEIFLFGITDSSMSIQKLCFNRIFKEFDLSWFNQEQICMIFRSAVSGPHHKTLVSINLPKLVSQHQNDLVWLVSMFNLRNDSEFISTLLATFYTEFHKKKGIHLLVKEFADSYLDEKAYPDTVKMKRPVILVWESLVTFCKQNKITIQQEDETFIEGEDESTAEKIELDLADSLLPDFHFFCKFLKAFIDHHIFQATKVRVSRSEQEDLLGSFEQIIKVSEYYPITEQNQPVFIELFKTILLRKDVFKLFPKYMTFFVPRMFHGWKVADAREAFELIKDVIADIQHKAENQEEEIEENEFDIRTFTQWSTSMFAGFARVDFLLELERSNEVLIAIVEYGIKILEAVIGDFSHVTVREGLKLVHGLVYIYPPIWHQVAEFVCELLPGDTSLSERNVIALEILLDVCCLLPPNELELHHVFTEDDLTKELADVSTDQEKDNILLEAFFLHYLTYEPEAGERQPMSIRHMSYEYRVYRHTVFAVLRYILTNDFKSTKCYTNIMTAYLSNSAIDDGLYNIISGFLFDVLPLMKEKKIDPVPFMESFPHVGKNILNDEDKRANAEEDLMHLYLNVADYINSLDLLLTEANTMLPLPGMQKLYKRFFQSIENRLNTAAKADSPDDDVTQNITQNIAQNNTQNITQNNTHNTTHNNTHNDTASP